MRKNAQKLAVAACLLMCMNFGATSAMGDDALSLVPVPREITQQSGSLALESGSRIAVENRTLRPLAQILSHAVYLQTGVELKPDRGRVSRGSIFLRLDPELEPEAYSIAVADAVVVTGHDYRAVAWGVATLLQLVDSAEGRVVLPRVRIEDAPGAEYRGVLLDLARRRHPVETVKDAINLMWLYKINYLHLHLSDTQSFVFPSTSLPKLPTPNWAYSVDEMKDIVAFADARGVAIIPEIDVPGHSSHWVAKMPETFGTTDPETGKSRSVGIVNMANEKAYQALDLLVGDLAEVFASSPFIHIGTDEVGAGGLMKLPEYLPYCEKHGLSQAASGKAHELFLHFIERMNEIVRSHGKQAIAWDDFRGAGTPAVTIPTNLVTMAWSGSPFPVAEKGYPVINCCWLPLYMVPPQQRAPEAFRIYDWDLRRFARWDSRQPWILPEESPVMGAQICFWEQRYNEVLPILRPRLPAFAERLWHPEAGRTFEDFKQRRDHTDAIAQKIIFPVSIEAAGLLDEEDVCFEESLTVNLRSSAPGTIRYALSKPWEQFPDAGSDVYAGPITLEDTMTVSARLYDDDGVPVGGITQQRFRKTVPAYEYRLLGPTPQRSWETMPDFADLEVLRSGLTGLMTRDHADQINRSMFAGLRPHGHVDVRVHNAYNPLTLELKGQIRFPEDGEYTFKLMSRDGLSELYIGDCLVVGAKVSGRDNLSVGSVKAGTYPLTIKHFYRSIFNDLNIMVKTPGATEFEPYESLVLPRSEWVAGPALGTFPADCRFEDPVKLANANLATDKPVTVSGGTQGDHRPVNAVDGVLGNSSGWHADPYPQWLQVDLGEVHRIGRLKVHTYYGGGRYYQYTIEVSRDGKQWEQVVDMTKNVAPATKNGEEHNITTVGARYVRINMLVNSANPGVHLNELMVYEAEEE